MNKTAYIILIVSCCCFTLLAGCIESHVQKSETVITKLDTMQNVQWTAVIENVNYSSARSSAITNRIIQTSDNGYFVAGEFSEKSSGKTGIRLIKTDGYGKTEWEKRMVAGDVEVLTIIQRPDNGYSVITRQGHVYNFDASGTFENIQDISEQINTRSINTTAGEEYPPVTIQYVTRTSEGELISLVKNYADIYNPLCIIRLSPNGTVLSTIIPDQTVARGTTNIITTGDQGFLLGKSRYVSLQNMTQIVIEKTDTNASLLWSSRLGLCNQSYCDNDVLALQELENQEYGVVYLSSERNDSPSGPTHLIVTSVIDRNGQVLRQDRINATEVPAWVFSQAWSSPELIGQMSMNVPAISFRSGYTDNLENRIDSLIKTDDNGYVILGSRYYLNAGMGHQPIDQSGNSTITENITPVIPMMIDADFDIMEANVSEVKYINSTPVTFEDMRMYPEFESYMHGVNNDSNVWHRGWRYVNTFPGNLSTYDVLVKKICNGKNIFECNRGTLIEYHNQYYKVSIHEYGTMQRNPNW